MTREEIFEVVCSNIVTIVEGTQPETISESVSLRDLGADSLQIVEVVSRSMKELRLKVPRTELSRARNISELLDLFERAASSAS
jgi:acyl carrier protein